MLPLTVAGNMMPMVTRSINGLVMMLMVRGKRKKKPVNSLKVIGEDVWLMKSMSI